MTADSARLAALVPTLAGRRILIVGDVILDEYLVGRPSRLSREAPVLILEYKESRYAPGGGANAAANLVTLGARVRVVGRVGRDAAGDQILALL